MEQAALDNGVDAVLLLALARAESGLDPAAERWGARTRDALRFLRAEQWGALAELTWAVAPDISIGLSQVTVGTAGGYGVGDGSLDLDNVLFVRERLFDPAVSLDVGARHLAGCLARVEREAPDWIGWDLAALVVYNAGHLPEPDDAWWDRWAGNVASYRAALEWTRGATLV